MERLKKEKESDNAESIKRTMEELNSTFHELSRKMYEQAAKQKQGEAGEKGPGGGEKADGKGGKDGENIIDAEFKTKSEQKIKDLRDEAGTVFLVSHSLEVVTSTCNRAIWLDKGVLKMDGEAKEVVDAYTRETTRK